MVFWEKNMFFLHSEIGNEYMSYILHIAILTNIYTILTLSLNLTIGYIGLPVLGHAGFACIGAYASTLLVIKLHFSPWISMLFAGIISSIFSLGVSIPAIRLKGDYLALATFGFGVITYNVVRNWESLTYGAFGISGIPTISLSNNNSNLLPEYFIISGAMMGISYFSILALVNSSFGYIIKGIKYDEIIILSMGINTTSYKVATVAISAFYAGIAGSLFAHYITFIDPTAFTISESLLIVIMVILGGISNIKGAFFGSFVLIVFPEILRFLGLPSTIAAPIRQISYGLMLILLILYRPQGIMGKQS
jgi:branched-chain amino acid transport system permease protein